MSLRCTCLRAFALAAALACLAVPGGVSADTGARPAAPAPARSIVTGVVWNPDNSPYPNGRVRLRNLHTGRVEAAAVTTERGQFTFNEVASGSYLTEVVDAAAKVIAVGQPFSVEAGETAATFVRLPARKSWLAGAFSNTAAAVIAAASSAGVTAIGSQAPPVSPQ
ncbi:MAG TPA: carboxypeptidase-like regulatory domain-containing protein [Vicinamibacterales bacterium]|nr:carboxypeptidase-like regulatory domain-containing protein [Vicinamibacterales bacterium]